MPSNLLAELIIVLYTFRQVVVPAALGFFLSSMYLHALSNPNPGLAFLIVASGLGYGTYKLIFVPDPRKPTE